ncbi:Increased DNA methylation 1, partial [Mucuna pruriens]
MAYTLRPQGKNVAYADLCADSNDTESDSNNHDQDYSRMRPRKPTKRRNTTSSTTRAIKTKKMDLIMDSSARRTRHTRNHLSKKTAAGGQNMESSGVGQSSRVGRGSPLHEDPSPSMENGTPASTIGQDSDSPSKKTGDEHNKETTEDRQSLGVEKSSRMKKGPNNEIGRSAKSSRTKRGSVLLEHTRPTTENNCSRTLEGHSSSMRISSSLPKGTSSSKKTILSWLIDCKIIEEDEQVYYYKDDTKESAAITGAITRVGILCSCCQEEISVWTFEKHADSDLKQPYKHICLPKKGTSLQDCLTTAWYAPPEQKRREPFDYTLKDQNDSACLICGDGGDLFYCTNKKCHSAYHAFCMDMKSNANVGFPVALGIVPIAFANTVVLNVNRNRSHACSVTKSIYEKLESSLATRTDISEGISWRVIQPVDMISKLHLARTLRLENNLKVAIAFKLMNESFKTITDSDTGIDVVHGVLYSLQSDLKRINFSRFHTFILEKDDAIICAASIRIHGRRFAEMPFIATDETFRGQGFCSQLMTAIESYLSDIKVQTLIILAVPDTSEMWKLKYGFQELTRELHKEINSYSILMLPNAIKLCKDLKSLAEGTSESEYPQETENQNADKELLDLNMDPA